MRLEELYLEVLLSPDDAALRAVYLDALHERGLETGLALPRLITEPVIRNGLLDECTFTDHPAPELNAEPIWNAVRTLRNPPHEILAQASSLEHAHDVSSRVLLEWAASRTKAPRLTSLGIRADTTWGLWGSLLALDLPKLTSLSLRLINEGLNARHNQRDEIGAQCCEECAQPRPFENAPSLQPEHLAPLFEAPLGRNLTTLELHLGWVNVAHFTAALERTRCDVPTIHLRGAEENGVVPAWRFTLERTAPGRYRKCTLTTRPTTADERLDCEAIDATIEKTR